MSVGTRHGDARPQFVAAAGAVCLLCLAALLVLARVSQRTAWGQRLDDRASRTVVAANVDAVRPLFQRLAEISVGTVVVGVVILVALALLRRQVRAAAAAAAIVGLANVATQAFKAGYQRADFGYTTYPSLPSGHETVVASLVLAALVAAPTRVRPAVSALGSAGATGMATLLLVAGWHRPADIVAALLVCLGTGSAVLGGWVVLSPSETLRPSSAGRVIAQLLVHGALGLLGAAVAGAFVIWIGVRPEGGMSGLLRAAAVLGALGLSAVLVVALFAALSAPLVGSRHRPLAGSVRRSSDW